MNRNAKLATLLAVACFSPLATLAYPQQPVVAPAHLLKLAHTYSIVAYDSATGDLGVAVQSKFPNVGGIVPWGRAGVGAVATQSLGNTAYGERGLDLIAQGATAEEAEAQISQVVEGLTTAPVLRDLSHRRGIELPIT
jgi:hypothetical protein